MHRPNCRFLPHCLVLVITFSLVAFAESRFHAPSPTGGGIEITTTCPTRGVTSLQFRSPQLSLEEVTIDGECFTDVWIEGESHTTDPGLPCLPIVSRLIGIPDHGAVQLTVISAEYTEQSGYRIYPFQGMEEAPAPQFRWNRDFYNQDTWYPEQVATVGEPAVFRDVRLVNVSVCPVQYNPAAGTIRTYHNIDVQVQTVPGVGMNEKTRTFPHPSSLFLPMYRELLNFQYLGMDEHPEPPGTYLIICADDSIPIGFAEQLAVWKQRKGIPTRTETGSTFSLIKQYVQTAYDTWDPPLEFVLLLGDDTGNPDDPFHVPSSGGYSGSDHPYTQLAGDDILGEIAIGRLSAENAAMMNYVVTKTLRYEQDPYLTGPDWFTKGYLTAGTGFASSYFVTSTVSVMEYIRTKMYAVGFTDVVLHTHLGHINASLMRQMIDSGRSFYFARPCWLGQISVQDLNGLSNGWMLPFATMLTCGTGNFAGSGATLSEAWLRYGSPVNGGGAIGCIGGATTGNHTRFLNTVAFGIGHSFFVYGVHQPGIALMEGKWQLYRNYYSWESISSNITWYNLMGDPGIPIWTAFPDSFLVSYPAEIPLGANRVPVQIHDRAGDPIAGALVCLMKSEETWSRALTDESGYLEMPTGPETEGILWLTVSKPNFVPFQADITVAEQEIYLGFVAADIDDDTTGGTFGNNDGELNPGEVVDLTITARNFGDSVTATNVIGTLFSFDTTLAQVTISQQAFPDITPHSQAQSQGAFRVQISPYAQDQDHTPLLLAMASSQQTDTSLVSLTIISGRAQFNDYQFLLSNNRLDPGETEELLVSWVNLGHRDLTNVQGHLFTIDPRITFPGPNASFGAVAVGDTMSNSGDPFQITADPITIPGHPVTIGIALSGDDGFLDTTYFSFEVGIPEVWDPVGPDNYGYYCFDNIDTSYEEAPEYDWIEIDPAYGGTGELLPLVDSVETTDDNVVCELPFTFRFYGIDYDSITICSNGWAALGSQPQFENFRNYHIPGPDGPDAMLAAFWDELVMGQGHVFMEYIENDGILVIEWSRVATLHDAYPETFEIILYDPNVWLTPTGDGLIAFQYLVVNNVIGEYWDNDYATVGIENHTQLDGLEITYWNTYSPGAAPLEAGRAYLFTTLEPFSGTEPDSPHLPQEYSLGQNYPNPFNQVTVIPYSIHQNAQVSLSVYNVLGQRVANLVNQRQDAGYHQVLFNAASLSSGIYFYQLEAGAFIKTRKMVLLK